MTNQEYADYVQQQLPLLRRKARRLVGRDEADDVVHNAVINVWRSRGPAIVDLRAVLISAVRNAAKDYLDGVDKAQSVSAYLDREQPRPTPVTEDDLIARVDLQRALAALPADVRQAILAVYGEGSSWDAAAEELGVRRTTLQKRVNKWLPFLRENLGWQKAPASPSVKWRR
jgi:RNA polymerase sigma-70 factor (ECF subfamily)